MSDKRRLSAASDSKIKNLVLISLFAAVIAACSLITIPIIIPPLTMQLFGIFCALCLLGGKRGTLAVLLYVLIGCLGVPVFSGFTGGFLRLFDATGGFITGFILSALIYWLITHFSKGTGIARALALLASLCACYLSGTLWYALFYSRGDFLASLKSAFLACVVPFIIPDLLKIAAAFFVCRKIEKYKIF